LTRSPQVLALIPALNEAEALPTVLQGLAQAGISRVMVVDNGSTDGTAEVARRWGAQVVREPRRGYGAACLAGMKVLEEMTDPPDIVLFLDGDGSDEPQASASLVDPVRKRDADLVVGVRPKTEEDGGGVPFHARWGEALIRSGARILHGVEFSDLGPFRAIRWEALQALEMDDVNWGWTLQMQLRAHHSGLGYLEVAVPHRRRIAGRSKVSGSLRGSVMAGLKMGVVLLRELRAR